MFVPDPKTGKFNWSGLLLLFAYVLLIAACLFVAESVWRAHRQQVQLQEWPAVRAQVVTCFIYRDYPFADDGGGVIYSTECRFRYEANGVTLESRTHTTSTRSQKMLGRMENWISRHPKGSTQIIHYEPANPHTISLAGADEEIQTHTAASKLRAGKSLALAGLGFLIVALIVRRWTAAAVSNSYQPLQ